MAYGGVQVNRPRRFLVEEQYDESEFRGDSDSCVLRFKFVELACDVGFAHGRRRAHGSYGDIENRSRFRRRYVGLRGFEPVQNLPSKAVQKLEKREEVQRARYSPSRQRN